MGIWRKKEFTNVPEKYSDYKGSYIMSEKEIQEPALKYRMMQLLTELPYFADYQDDGSNLTGALKHLESKGIDITVLQPLFSESGRLNGFPDGILYVPGSQNGNEG